MPRMFGTDGVRGLANRALTAQLALDLGDAAVRVLGDDGDKSEFDGRRRALVGRDTRVSGDFLAAALSAGMSAGGFDVIDAGTVYMSSILSPGWSHKRLPPQASAQCKVTGRSWCSC